MLSPLPWHQLRSFAYDAGNTADVAALLGLMRNVSHDAAFEVRSLGAIMPPPASATQHHIHHHLPPLDRLPRPDFAPDHSTSRSSFGLPHAAPPPRAILVKPTSDTVAPACIHSPFSTLLIRNMLRSLDIRYVAVTRDDLIHSLASLESLTQLVISDQLDEELVITDTLLRRLALTSDPDKSCLVPQLRFLDCTSLFQFSADAYLDFAMSRVTHGTTLFQGILRDFSGRSCRFEVANHQTLLDFVTKQCGVGQ